ncbi:MAG: hypothetical protein POG24_06940, partial [Acidocella sp.]|nr:hypothetical protein [Acidocella sp.]
MAKATWTNNAGGDFANAANWSTGSVPGSADDALLTAIGTYTVTSSQNETVNSLQMISTVTFSILGGTFDALNGSGSGTDAGLIEVGSGTAFEVGGTLAGAGTVALNSVNSTAQFLIGANATLSGGGKLTLNDNGNNYIIAAGGGLTLTNVNNIISGAGQLGYGSLAINNQAGGTIDATGVANALILNAGGAVLTNAGLIEATGAGGFVVQSSTISQSGAGLIKAVGAGDNVVLNGGAISGGKLASSAGGMIESVGNGYLDNITLTTGSMLAALDNTNLFFSDTITNAGTIAISSAGSDTSFWVNTATLTLTGGGTVQLSDNANNYFRASNGNYQLVNVNNIISGAGQLGYGSLAIDNQAGGTIDASGTLNALVLNAGGAVLTNAGLIEATGKGGFVVQSSTISQSGGGLIKAVGAGDNVVLNNGAISGGTLTTSAGGMIESVGNGYLDNITLTTGSMLAALDNTNLFFSDTITNAGTIAISSAGSDTSFWVNTATLTLTGGGTVQLSDNANNYVRASNGNYQLVNVNNIISGAGQLGYGSLAIDNQAGGTIDASGTLNALVLNAGGAVLTNAGLIEATGKGGFVVQSSTISQSGGGLIKAVGAGDNVVLNNGAISGGTLTTSAGGMIESVGNGYLDNITLTT